MDYVTVAHIADIPPGEGRCFEVGDRQIGVFRVGDAALAPPALRGTSSAVPQVFYAIDNTCPHAFASLAAGWIEGCVVTCPAHGWTYDVRSGLPPAGDYYEPIASYPVRVVGDEIQVLPEPRQVDPESERPSRADLDFLASACGDDLEEGW